MNQKISQGIAKINAQSGPRCIDFHRLLKLFSKNIHKITDKLSYNSQQEQQREAILDQEFRFS